MQALAGLVIVVAALVGAGMIAATFSAPAAKLAAQAGCSGCTMEKVTLPLAPGSSDDVVFVGLNGADFYFMRGRQVEMPAPIAEILRNTGHL